MPPTDPLRPIIPDNARPSRLTAAAGTKLAGASSSGNVIIFPDESTLQPTFCNVFCAFLMHAALLDQAFAHCPIFLTADSRKSLDLVSVPMWLIILSNQLMIIGLVRNYRPNYLIIHKPIF
jgi:hypothetical protein